MTPHVLQITRFSGPVHRSSLRNVPGPQAPPCPQTVPSERAPRPAFPLPNPPQNQPTEFWVMFLPRPRPGAPPSPGKPEALPGQRAAISEGAGRHRQSHGCPRGCRGSGRGVRGGLSPAAGRFPRRPGDGAAHPAMPGAPRRARPGAAADGREPERNDRAVADPLSPGLRVSGH